MGFVVVEKIFQKVKILKRFLKGFYYVIYPIRMSLVRIIHNCNSLNQLFAVLRSYRSNKALLVKDHFFVFLTNVDSKKDQLVEEILLLRL